MTRRKKRRIQRFFSVGATLGLMLVVGCATNGILAGEKISQGDRAISDAKLSNGSLNAPAELKVAEDKLTQAKVALADKDYGKATRLAEQASVDAEYAGTKAKTEKAKKKVEEMKQEVEALRQEIDRLSKL